MQVQQVSVKVFARSSDFDRDALIPIFHQWIRDRRLPDALLIDVADYRHVPRGPGVMLIAHEAHYGLDEGDGRPGLLYGRKRDPLGDARDKLRQAVRSALTACQALEAEPAVAGRLEFDVGALEIRVMSRLCARNTDADFERLQPVLDQVLGPAFGPRSLSSRRVGTDQQPLTVRVSCNEGTDRPSLTGTLAQL